MVQWRDCRERLVDLDECQQRGERTEQDQLGTLNAYFGAAGGVAGGSETCSWTIFQLPSRWR